MVQVFIEGKLRAFLESKNDSDHSFSSYRWRLLLLMLFSREVFQLTSSYGHPSGIFFFSSAILILYALVELTHLFDLDISVSNLEKTISSLSA